jgi:hypothetical protein
MATKKAKKVNMKSMSFAGVNGGAVLAIPGTEDYQTVFRVRRHVKDRVSQPVALQALHFDKKDREIRVFGADGLTRKCKVDRLPSLDDARALWTKLQEVGKAGKEIQFVAAGGYSPDSWFYTIKE